MLKFFKQRFQFHYYPQARPNQASQCLFTRDRVRRRGAGRPKTCRLSQSTCPSVIVRSHIPASSSLLAPRTRSSAWPTTTPCGPCSPLRGTASTTGRPSSSWPPGAACWSAGWCWADFTSVASTWWPPISWAPLCCLWGWWCWWLGMVLMPVTRQMRHQSAMKRLCSYYKPHINLWGQCEGIVHPKIKLLSSFIHPPLVPNLFHTGRRINVTEVTFLGWTIL